MNFTIHFKTLSLFDIDFELLMKQLNLTKVIFQPAENSIQPCKEAATGGVL